MLSMQQVQASASWLCSSASNTGAVSSSFSFVSLGHKLAWQMTTWIRTQIWVRAVESCIWFILGSSSASRIPISCFVKCIKVQAVLKTIFITLCVLLIDQSIYLALLISRIPEWYIFSGRGLCWHDPECGEYDTGPGLAVSVGTSLRSLLARVSQSLVSTRGVNTQHTEGKCAGKCDKTSENEPRKIIN